jgi:hypothetical protein
MIEENIKIDIYKLIEPENKIEKIGKQRRIMSCASAYLSRIVKEKLSGKMGVC